jgi:hypothetical protein
VKSNKVKRLGGVKGHNKFFLGDQPCDNGVVIQWFGD